MRLVPPDPISSSPRQGSPAERDPVSYHIRRPVGPFCPLRFRSYNALPMSTSTLPGTPLRSIGLLLPLILALPGTVLAQELPRTALAEEETGDTWFPSERYFARPLASNREPVFALRLLGSTVFRGRSAPSERSPFDFPGQDGLDVDVQGEAALGGAFRIWQPIQWNGGGLILGLQAGVFGRFRLEVSSSDLVASDWIVSLPAEVAWGSWSARLKITHWSAHIGDEMIEGAGAEQVDFTSETLDALAAYQYGWLRVYGGGGRGLSVEPRERDSVRTGFLGRLPAERRNRRQVAAMGPRRCDVERWHRLASQRPGAVGESDFGPFGADDARRRGFEAGPVPPSLLRWPVAHGTVLSYERTILGVRGEPRRLLRARWPGNSLCGPRTAYLVRVPCSRPGSQNARAHTSLRSRRHHMTKGSRR